jgi:rare lipoprotein A (peptidoglycan hydrolase)
MRLKLATYLSLVVLMAALSSGCAPTKEVGGETVLKEYPEYTVLDCQSGKASYYNKRLHGRKTASGQRYSNSQYTAAHKKYPFGTHVRVVSLKSGKSVIVTINDRGPRGSRIIDVSYAAAQELGMLRAGTDEVRLEVLAWGRPDDN